MKSSVMVSGAAELYKNVIKQVAQSLFGKSIQIQVQGSFAKNTFWRESDVDILLDTSKPVSLKEREEMVSKLRLHPLFHKIHVKLGKLAIHINALLDMDLVFSNTVEYGIRPRASTGFQDNPGAQNAARVLQFVCR